MPHSGGGGSSDSGAHSDSGSNFGSDSGGGGSSYSGARNRSSGYEETCTNRNEDVWVRYDNGEPRFRYVEKKAYRKYRPVHNLLVCLLPAILIPLLAVFALSQATGISLFPTKEKPDYVTEPSESETWDKIEDSAVCYTKEEKKDIETAIEALYLSSGIKTQVVTITEEMFQEADRKDLETLAYSEYVNRFSDEDHFLILFEDKGNGSWAFEIMEGDNTSEWLTQDVSYYFDQLFTENLWATSRFSYGTALSSALTDTVTYMQEHAGEPSQQVKEDTQWLRMTLLGLMAPILLAGFLLLIKRLSIGTIESRMAKDGFKKVDNARIVIDTRGRAAPQMLTCEYCGGIYPYGMLSCPHCGAPARADISSEKSQ